jgi:hypothetical protein
LSRWLCFARPRTPPRDSGLLSDLSNFARLRKRERLNKDPACLYTENRGKQILFECPRGPGAEAREHTEQRFRAFSGPYRLAPRQPGAKALPRKPRTVVRYGRLCLRARACGRYVGRTCRAPGSTERTSPRRPWNSILLSPPDAETEAGAPQDHGQHDRAGEPPSCAIRSWPGCAMPKRPRSRPRRSRCH